jgi:hypothetical protein
VFTVRYELIVYSSDEFDSSDCSYSYTEESSLQGQIPYILVLGVDVPLFRRHSMSQSSGKSLLMDFLNGDSAIDTVVPAVINLKIAIFTSAAVIT